MRADLDTPFRRLLVASRGLRTQLLDLRGVPLEHALGFEPEDHMVAVWLNCLGPGVAVGY